VQITIRPAHDRDTPFLAWVMYTAARSHLDECPWRVIFGETEARTLVLLEHMTRIPALSWSCVANFRIAEVDGTPAAAMCGFSPGAGSVPHDPQPELDLARRVFAYSEAHLAGVSERLGIAALGMPRDLPDVWAIENVAVLPEYRGKGLIDKLFERVFQEGRDKGFMHVQIHCLIGNEPGLRTFERNGFRVVSQQTSAAFNDLFGAPGAKLLAQAL